MCNKLINIILGCFLFLQPEFLLFYEKTDKNFILFTFYINNIFAALKSYQK